MIKQILFCFLFLLSFYCISGAEERIEQANLYLVKDGKPTAVIVVPERADGWCMRAAEWIRDYVEKSSGARFKIMTENQVTSGTIISVGHTRLAEKAGIKVNDLKWDGCRLIAKENILYLIGRDEIIYGSLLGAKGTCKSVVTFLEDFLGVRWFLPIPEGELIPRRIDIAVPGNLDKTIIPLFASCHGSSVYEFGTPAAIANNYKSGVKILSYGGHSFPQWVPARKYFDQHPEYFALIDGNRISQGNHLCTTNPEVKKILLKSIRKNFDTGYDWVALGAEDGYLRCQCPECEKLDNFRDFGGSGFRPKEGETWEEFLDRNSETPCERLLLLYKWIADECKKSHPDKKVHMLIYAPTLFPSKKFDKFGDNVVGELAFYHKSLDLKILDMWKNKVSALSIMHTWFNLSIGNGSMGVMMTPREVARMMRAYKEKKVICIYIASHTSNWGLQGASYYVKGKMMGNPDLDYNALVEEYCMGLYGKAGKAMKDFFDILYTRSTREFDGTPANLLRKTSELHLQVYPLEFLQRLEPFLTKAEEIAKTDSEKVRKLVELTRLHFDYLKLLTHMLTSYKVYLVGMTPGNFQKLKERVDAFEDFRLKVLSYDDEYVRYWPDHDEFCNFLVGEGMDKNYYTSWWNRKKQIDLKNPRGLAIGYSGSSIQKPITLDFR